jgi:apolipoprotein N-acyltransferase
MKFLLASLLLGIVSACGFAPWSLWPLTLLAFAGLLWLIREAPSLRSALARGYWFGVGQFVLGLNWIATAFTFQAKMPHWLGWIAVVLLSLYLAVYPAMATGLAWRWGKSPLAREREGIALVLILAAAWAVTEWLRATMFTGFAWNPVGVVLIDSWAKWAATVIGTYGLSALLVLLSGLLWLILSRRSWLRFLPAAALILLLMIDLKFVARQAEEERAGQLALRIVQPNIGQQDKWTEGFEARNFARLARLTGPAAARPRLILWPEAAVTDPLGDNRPAAAAEVAALRRRVGSLLGPNDLLLTGGITLAAPDGLRVTQATNSVFAMDASGRVLGRFDKAHLVPYGEYLPMRPILSAIGLSRLAPGDLDYIPGPGAQTLTLPLAGEVGFQLCYEIIFSGEVVDPDNRPAFIYNPSNDAWFGAWGPPQHLAQARLRALEEGLPVLRSTPTGISAVVDAEGRLLHSLPWRTAGVIEATLPPPKPPTLFSRLGNVAPFLFALLLVLIAVAVRRKAR